jgi:hypothetical protein
MHQLHRNRTQQIVSGGVTIPRSGCGQGERGPEPLAAGSQQVGGDLVEKAVAGHYRLHEQGLEAPQLIFECGKSQELYDVHFLQTIGHVADD